MVFNKYIITAKRNEKGSFLVDLNFSSSCRVNVLKIKFDIDCTLHKSRNHYTVYIRVDSAKNLYPKIKNYIVPSMRYKFEKKILSL